MYTQEELQGKSLPELKEIGWQLNALPDGDRRLRRNWIRAIEEAAKKSLDVEVQEPVTQAAENSPAAEVQEPIAQAAENSPAVEIEPVQEAPLESKFGRIVYPKQAAKPIAQAAKNSPGVEVGYVEDNLPDCVVCFDDKYIEDTSGHIFNCSHCTEPKVSQSAIAPAAQNSPGVTQAQEPIECSADGYHFQQPDGRRYMYVGIRRFYIIEPTMQEAVDMNVYGEPDYPEWPDGWLSEPESDRNPILTSSDAWNPAEFGEVLHAAEPSGQLNWLEWDVSEPPEPDDYEGDMFAFQAAYDRWLSTSELHEIIHTKNSPGVESDRNPILTGDSSLDSSLDGYKVGLEPITQNATTKLEFPRNESADLRFVDFHPAAQPDGNCSSTEIAGLANQEGDRVLEVQGNPEGCQGRVISRQPAQLSQSRDSHTNPQSSHEQQPPDPGDGHVSLELKIGMLVGRRRDRQHLGKILAIYKSRRGIWRAKIKPLNKSNFVYFDCAALIEQRLLYDYEMKPGGFVLTGEIFNKARCEHFEVLSRKVRSPKPTNWTAGELSSLSTFKLKQIARDMEIPSIPGTAGKRSLIRAILAEQTILQEKVAAQRERETGRAIVQKQKSVRTAGKKKRAAASPPGAKQLSLFEVAV